MQQVMYILEYMKSKPKLTLYMDASLPQIYYGYLNTKREYFLNTTNMLNH